MPKQKERVVVALSGGMDSGTLLGDVIDQGMEVVQTVGFRYGSKHNPYENEAARKLAKFYRVPHRLIDLTNAFDGARSDLMAEGGDIPEGHYEADSMKRTVVPGRNLIFAAILASIAESNNAYFVFMGIHAGDHHIYPDCRPEFAIALAAAIKASTEGKVDLAAPYLRYHKLDILKRGFQIGVPYEYTRTCYKDQPIACGKCGSCQERLTAFNLIGIKDPIDYKTRTLLGKE